MGGETLLTKRFENLVDELIKANRTDIGLSFVTNGTLYPETLIEKLKQFARVGIEVSIESVSEHNTYQRQGTDTALVLKNIDLFNQHSNNDNITVTLRPAVSALTVGAYHTLLDYAHQKGLVVKALIVMFPEFLSIPVLPIQVRLGYQHYYEELLQRIDVQDTLGDYNVSDPHNVDRVIAEQARSILSWLATPETENVIDLRRQMAEHCAKWDAIYDLDAVGLYPELADFFSEYGYNV
jgi:hypothetical protein